MQCSIIILTKNEGRNIERCLKSVSHFDDIHIIDSNSTDKTCAIAKQHQAHITQFLWNKRYPKKRQWFLENVQTKYDYIFFLDADETMSKALIKEIKTLKNPHAGYFIKSDYVLEGRTLKHGLKNNKLVLFDRKKFYYPNVHDQNFEGMGEIEGHFQPVLKDSAQVSNAKISHLKNLTHHHIDRLKDWHDKHQNYAIWEAHMRVHNLYPQENRRARKILKFAFKHSPLKPYAAFTHSFLLKRGFCDRKWGYALAKQRFDYYKMVKNNIKRIKTTL